VTPHLVQLYENANNTMVFGFHWTKLFWNQN